MERMNAEVPMDDRNEQCRLYVVSNTSPSKWAQATVTENMVRTSWTLQDRATGNGVDLASGGTMIYEGVLPVCEDTRVIESWEVSCWINTGCPWSGGDGTN